MSITVARDPDCHPLFSDEDYQRAEDVLAWLVDGRSRPPMYVPAQIGLASELEDGMTRDDLQEKVNGLIVPIEPAEWGRRMRELRQEARELRRRSPFPQQHFTPFDTYENQHPTGP